MSNYALEGPTWSNATITWSFAAAGGTFTGAIGAAYQSAVTAALSRWSQVANVTFKQAADSVSNVNIRIGWGQFSGSQIGETDYSYQISGKQTFINGVTVRLEDPAALSLSSAPGAYYQGTSTALYQVALHEIGHALGLAHSTDPNAVMYASLGPSNTDLDTTDISGIESLYGGSNAAGLASNSAVPVVPAAVVLSNAILAVYRFFDSTSGTQFLTANVAERNTVIATRPDLAYEGLAMGAIAPNAADPYAAPVYRFFDTANGTHFFTASQTEAQQITATRSDLALEQVTFDEHLVKQAGDIPVYRFFDAANGDHFFTASDSERASLAANRSDMVFEGIAFYAPTATPVAAGALASQSPAVVSLTDDTAPVYRFFNTTDGTQFLTASAAERDAAIAGRPNLAYQGVGMGAVAAAADDPNAVPVYRFFDTTNGTHFYTASQTEQSAILANRPDMVAEGTSFLEHAVQQAGDQAVYRFYDAANGSHFFTASDSERAALLTSRPDMVVEGIAFYAPST